MFGISGDFHEVFPEIFMALQDVARNDPLLDTRGIQLSEHSDGWGYVALSRDGLVHYKTSMPVYDSAPIIAQNGFMVAHARKASPSEPRGVANSHPFHASDQSMDIYLAHNGAFDKAEIAKILGIGETKDQTDSEFFLKLVIAQRGALMQRLEDAIGIAKEHRLLTGTPNLLLLGVRKDTMEPEILYYTAPPDSGKYGDYNRLYFVGGRGWSGVFSSSIIGSEFFPEDVETEQVKPGRVFSLEEESGPRQIS